MDGEVVDPDARDLGDREKASIPLTCNDCWPGQSRATPWFPALSPPIILGVKREASIP